MSVSRNGFAFFKGSSTFKEPINAVKKYAHTQHLASFLARARDPCHQRGSLTAIQIASPFSIIHDVAPAACALVMWTPCLRARGVQKKEWRSGTRILLTFA